MRKGMKKEDSDKMKNTLHPARNRLKPASDQH
jgi:hypothetical protein